MRTNLIQHHRWNRISIKCEFMAMDKPMPVEHWVLLQKMRMFADEMALAHSIRADFGNCLLS